MDDGDQPPWPPRRLVEYFVVVSCKRGIPPTPSSSQNRQSIIQHSENTIRNEKAISHRRQEEIQDSEAFQIRINTQLINESDNDDQHIRNLDQSNAEECKERHETSSAGENFQTSYEKDDNIDEDQAEEKRLTRRFNMRAAHFPPDDDVDNDDEFIDERIQEEADPSLNEITSSPSCTKVNEIPLTASSGSSHNHRDSPHYISKHNHEDLCSLDCDRSCTLTPAIRDILPTPSLDLTNDSPSGRKTSKSKNASYYFSSRRVPVISEFDLVMQPFQRADLEKVTSFTSFQENIHDDDDSSLSSDLSMKSHHNVQDSFDASEAQGRIDTCGVLPDQTVKFSPQKPIRQEGSYPSENIRLPGNTPVRDPNLSSVSYRPVITARYPLIDHIDNPLNAMVTQFIFPNSTSMELSTEYRLPRLHSFVLTNEKGQKIYGTCLTVWEEYSPDPDIDVHDPIATIWNEGNDSMSFHENVELFLPSPTNNHTKYYLPKAICILSSWPYLQAFGEYITALYQLATMTNAMEIPLERYVLNICEEVPVPYPGAFQVQLKIFQSTIRFWAPATNLPIPYVALPYRVLFECLDVDNVIFVCLLFPMRWNHLYVPILPRFLTPMLDAPMPYLCGITRDNFLHAVRNINEETIVVDLDRNVITMTENTPDLPPIPLNRRSKLEAVLDEIASPVFWSARGLSSINVQVLKSQKDMITIQRLTDTAELVWKKKLRSYDHAFNIADIPDSKCEPFDDNDVVENVSEPNEPWGIVQDSFLRFFVSMLKEYRNFLSVPHKANDRDRWKAIRTFNSEQFIKSQRGDFQPFLEEFCRTQLFDDFITRRVASHADELDMIFFDQSITAKINRSKMTLKKKKTPFLKNANAHKRLRVFEAVSPNSDHLPSDYERQGPCIADCSDWRSSYFSYPSWPETFHEAYFGSPRMIPEILKHYDRKTSITFKVDNDKSNIVVPCDATLVTCTLEAASFTLFFIIYSDTIGRLESDGKLTNESAESAKASNDETGYINEYEDSSVGYLCTCDSSTILEWCDQNMKGVLEWIWGYHDIHRNKEDIGGLHTHSNNTYISEDVAAKMLFVYSIIDMMKIRKVNLESESLKSLLMAVTRNGNRSLILQLFEALQTRGIKMNEDMHLTFKEASPIVDHIDSPLASSSVGSLDSSIQRLSNSFDVNRNSSLSEDDNAVKLWMGRYSLSTSISSSIARKTLTLTKKDKLLVTDEVAKKLVETKHLSLDFFGDLKIETNDICPQCSCHITEDELMLGWTACDYYDCTTECPKCSYRFVACFSVKSTKAEFIGSQGHNTPLYCELISPWVLRRELTAIIEHELTGAFSILHPEWRHKSYYNSTIWWNLIVTFERHKIPYSFMLYSQ